MFHFHGFNSMSIELDFRGEFSICQDPDKPMGQRGNGFLKPNPARARNGATRLRSGGYILPSGYNFKIHSSLEVWWIFQHMHSLKEKSSRGARRRLTLPRMGFYMAHPSSAACAAIGTR